MADLDQMKQVRDQIVKVERGLSIGRRGKFKEQCNRHVLKEANSERSVRMCPLRHREERGWLGEGWPDGESTKGHQVGSHESLQHPYIKRRS